MMFEQTGLILEGGGSRGAFTVGVLDFFMEKEIEFPYVIGVSAGAMNAVNFVSKQRGRARQTSVDIANQVDLISFKNILTNRSIFDLSYMFDSLPNEICPFDYDTFFRSPTRCVVTATNCNTGKPAYLEERCDRKRLMDILHASIALPFLVPIVEIDAIPYMDGGIADSIPLKESILNGYRKNVVVLTKPYGYRKEPSAIEKNMAILFYNKHPNLVRAIVNRWKMYNKQIEWVENLEAKGKIVVIRPEEGHDVSRTEKEYEPLMRLCQHGHDMAEAAYQKMTEYHENGKVVIS